MVLVLLAGIASAQDTNYNVTAYFFYGDGCPHCAAEEPFLAGLQEKYPELTVSSYETWYDKSNADFFVSMSSACGTKVVGVPTIFIGHKAVVGFDSPEVKGKEIEDEIKKCIEAGCIDLKTHIGENLTSCPSKEEQSIITLPLFGQIDTTKISLPIFTIIIGLLDGFNPCSMWTLLFLLTLLVSTGSRKKMLLIGGLFIFVSALGYFLFMTAWLNLFLFVGFFSFVRILVGSGSIIAGLINMKELFFFKKGPSLSIPDKHKVNIIKKMNKIIHEVSISSVIIGVSTLAITVNFVEFLCTAGFPAIFTKVLTLNNLHPIQYYSYILLYIIMYELDDLVVLGLALFFFSRKTLTEKQGRWMKFAAGIMMLILGIILILKPELLMFS